jgi:hypothetical protein
MRWGDIMRWGDFHRRVAGVLLVLAAATVVSGCGYLFGLGSSPEFPMPTPAATYREGRATVTVGTDAPVVLDRLVSVGTFDPSFGAEAAFRSADGWTVRIMGATKAGGMLGQSAFITIDRIVGLEHWTTYDPSRCIVTVTQADKKGLVGTATCKGLRWSDALGGSMGALEPTYIKDQPAFDAEITFEAKPSNVSDS